MPRAVQQEAFRERRGSFATRISRRGFHYTVPPFTTEVLASIKEQLAARRARVEELQAQVQRCRPGTAERQRLGALHQQAIAAYRELDAVRARAATTLTTELFVQVARNRLPRETFRLLMEETLDLRTAAQQEIVK